MRALALTFSGMTDLCAQEIRQLIGAKGTETSEGVLFEAELEDIFAVCYRAQSIARVVLVLSEGAFDALGVPKEYLNGTISMTGKSATKAQELMERIAAKKVYKNADIPLYLHFEEERYWLGIDLAGDCSKRDYRIFVGSETLKGGTAFAALLLAGYEPKHVLLDPFCRAGSVVIEAALHAAHYPVRFYAKEKMQFVRIFKEFDSEKFFAAQDRRIKDAVPGAVLALSPSFPSVQATRKNAKIAGVGKLIDFSRTGTDWLDLKFDKNSIDRVVTQPVEFTIGFPPEKAKRLAAEFFKVAAFILKKSGKICLILRAGKDEYIAAAKAEGFALKNERTVMQGKEVWRLLVFAQ
jgi:23S rRNA G2445 N2-methylase RlmL